MRRAPVLLLLALVAGACVWLLLRAPERTEFHDSPTVANRDLRAPAAAAAALTPAPAAPISGAEAARNSGARAPSALDRCLLRFLAADGQPLAAAAYFLRCDGDFVAQGNADTHGEAVIAPAAGAGAALVLAVGYAPFLGPVDLSAGIHDVVLPDGAVLAGQVFIDGQPAGEPVVLSLFSEHRWLEPAHGFEGLPVMRGFDSVEAQHELVLSSGADGRFACRGLPLDWKGRLQVEGDRFAAQGGDPTDGDAWSQWLDSPRGDLLVELRRRPFVRGRILGADGAPLDGGQISVGFHDRNRATSSGTSLHADGRFEAPLRMPAFEQIEIGIAPPGRPRHEFLIPRAQVPADYDLGDLQLPPVRYVLVRALEPSGAPLPEARISIDDGRTWIEGLDTQGEIRVAAPLGGFRLRALARRYLPAAVEVPPGTEGPVVAVLAPTNHLYVQVLDQDGRPTQRVLVQLRSDGPLLSEEAELQHFGQYLEAGQHRGSTWSSDYQKVEIMPDVDGVVRVSGLAVGTSIELRVQPEASPVAYEEALPTGTATGVIERTVHVELRLRTIRGRVLSTGGEPLAEAEVYFGPLGAEHWDAGVAHVATGNDGRFAMEIGAALREGSLRLERPGYVTMVQSPYSAPPSEAEVEFHLEPAAPLLVRVVDAAGTPVAASLAVEFGDRIFATVETEAVGVYTVDRLPHGLVTVRADVGGHVHEHRHDTAAPELVIEVPAPGALRVYLPPLELQPDGWLYLKLVETAGGGESWLYQAASQISGGSVLFPVVAPGHYRATLYHFPQQGGPSPAEQALTIAAGQTAELRF